MTATSNPAAVVTSASLVPAATTAGVVQGAVEKSNVRGVVDNDQVAHYQVTLKIGFRLED